MLLVLMMRGLLLPEQACGPVRTCLGCGERHSREELLRFVANQSGLVLVDLKRCFPGRGVYCCSELKCLESFMKKKGKILRALRITKIDCSSVLGLVDEYRLNIAD